MRHVTTFINKFSFVLTPMAGSLQATNNMHELRDFLLDATRYSVAFSLPILLFLGVFGDRVLYLWMGEGFDDWALIIILCAGYFMPISQSAVNRILVGLNAHGKAAVIRIIVVLCGYTIGVLWISQVGWTLHNAAILIAVVITVSNGVVMPVIACRRMDISFGTYLQKVFMAPIACGSVYFLTLVVCRVIFSSIYYQDVIWGAIIGGIVIVLLYWRWIASDVFRGKVTGFARRKLGGAQA
jgi:O-antigen/teichoic acid export membrane protein